jgi:hypothetical protein
MEASFINSRLVNPITIPSSAKVCFALSGRGYRDLQLEKRPGRQLGEADISGSPKEAINWEPDTSVVSPSTKLSIS